MWRTDTSTHLSAEAAPLVVAQSGFEEAGSDIIGIIIGFGIVVAILAIMIVAGKMIAANFQRNPRWASRGIDDFPWVLLAVCLMLLAVPIVTALLGGFQQESAQEWDDLIEGTEVSETEADPAGVQVDNNDEDEDEENEDEEDEDEDEEEVEEEESEGPEPGDPGDLPPEEQI